MARKYAFQSGNEQVGKSRSNDTAVSYKKTYSVCRAIKGMKVTRALEYLDNVIEHNEIVPLYKFKKGASRHPQANVWGANQGRWPEKSARTVRDLLVQAANNAKHLHQTEYDDLEVRFYDVGLSGQINHRRNYRAHGRVNAYDNEPCHIQLIVSPVTKAVEAPKELK